MARQPKYSLIGEATASFVQKVNEMFIDLYKMINEVASHEMLSDVHSDTRLDPETGVRRGDLITGQGTPQGADRIKWQRLPIGDEATVLKTSDGLDAEWGKVDLTLDVDNVLPVGSGGTGVTTLTDNAVLLGNAADDIQTVSGLGTAGQVLTSNGAGVAPTWQAAAGGETHTDGYWAPLTDGDVDETELIFADGATIMMWVPTP